MIPLTECIFPFKRYIYGDDIFILLKGYIYDKDIYLFERIYLLFLYSHEWEILFFCYISHKSCQGNLRLSKTFENNILKNKKITL